jgi:quinol monooxygenase YgiN
MTPASPPSTSDGDDELYIFARFHALPGCEDDVEAAIREVRRPTREEPGCLSYHACRSVRDPRLFYIHTRWRDEAAFDLHASLPHTIRFIERIEALIDHDLDVARTVLIHG